MKHLELHILQSVPVACLNRDDLNSPKTAIFGGVQRARVSSQSWKRAIREMAKEIQPLAFRGGRTKRFVYVLQGVLTSQKGFADKSANAIAEQVADIIETLDSKLDANNFKRIKTLMFFSDAEYQALANVIAESDEVKQALPALETALLTGDTKAADKAIKSMGKILEKGSLGKAIKSVELKDAADIAIFGRMVANDHNLTVEAASMFSHALSIHKVDNEIDFFAAVDDLQDKGDSGAGMTSTLEFNSATYYRFAAINLDMLADKSHLGSLTSDERKSIVRTFIEATIKAIPSARKATMNGNTMPLHVLGVVREKGHPVQLINAFENPIRSSIGYGARSVELLKEEYAKLKDTWGVEAVYAKSIPEIGMKEFLDGVVAHVD